MPSAYVKSLSRETGKSEAEIEKLWNKAKEITAETFNKKQSEFGSKEYKYTTGIVKNMLGIREELLDPSKFLNSNMDADEYLESVVVSSNFSIGHVFAPESGESEIEDDEDYEIEANEPEGNPRGEEYEEFPEEEPLEDDEPEEVEEKKEKNSDQDYPVNELDDIIDKFS